MNFGISWSLLLCECNVKMILTYLCNALNGYIQTPGYRHENYFQIFKQSDRLEDLIESDKAHGKGGKSECNIAWEVLCWRAIQYFGHDCVQGLLEPVHSSHSLSPSFCMRFRHPIKLEWKRMYTTNQKWMEELTCRRQWAPGPGPPPRSTASTRWPDVCRIPLL